MLFPRTHRYRLRSSGWPLRPPGPRRRTASSGYEWLKSLTCAASWSSGYVLNDQDASLVGIAVANIDDAERPPCAERDRVARAPVRDRARQRRRIGSSAVPRLEPE